MKLGAPPGRPPTCDSPRRKRGAGCSRWSTSDGKDVFEGWHDGYMRLADPVMHRRRITLDKRARRFCIEDILEARGEHDLELFFHCSEDCRVSPIPLGYALGRGSCTLILQLPRIHGAVTRLYCGSDSPAAGWTSPLRPQTAGPDHCMAAPFRRSADPEHRDFNPVRRQAAGTRCETRPLRHAADR
ncbi:MAG: heparinase II/III family protein [Betaproteobacteria bacterium]|nr:heparinase II/III family protein [Betaproteobacteria bacterium]